MIPSQEGQKMKCEVCGNEMMVLQVGGGDVICCGQSMRLLTESGEAEG